MVDVAQHRMEHEGDALIHRRMVCPGFSIKSDRCNSCHHRAVHDEQLNCKSAPQLGCPDCKEV